MVREEKMARTRGNRVGRYKMTRAWESKRAKTDLKNFRLSCQLDG